MRHFNPYFFTGAISNGSHGIYRWVVRVIPSRESSVVIIEVGHRHELDCESSTCSGMLLRSRITNRQWIDALGIKSRGFKENQFRIVSRSARTWSRPETCRRLGLLSRWRARRCLAKKKKKKWNGQRWDELPIDTLALQFLQSVG